MAFAMAFWFMPRAHQPLSAYLPLLTTAVSAAAD
jgi:hypothetical protein